MNEMKKVIDSIINNSGKIHDQPKKFIEENVIEKGENIIIDKNSTVPDNQFQEVTELIDENESLKIESKEKELIIKALIKNKNKRKYAAKDLGYQKELYIEKLNIIRLTRSICYFFIFLSINGCRYIHLLEHQFP